MKNTERRADFDEVANARLAHFLTDGTSIPWTEMRAYLEDWIQGKTVASPFATKSTLLIGRRADENTTN